MVYCRVVTVFCRNHRIEINRRPARVGTFAVCVPTHVALHYAGSGQSVAFLANRNVELAVPPLLWPVKFIKIGGHVELLSCSTVYSLYCGRNVM